MLPTLGAAVGAVQAEEAALREELTKAGCDVSKIPKKQLEEGEGVILNAEKSWAAEHTNPRQLSGTLSEVIEGADAFIGVSGPNLLSRDQVLTSDQRAGEQLCFRKSTKILGDGRREDRIVHGHHLAGFFEGRLVEAGG